MSDNQFKKIEYKPYFPGERKDEPLLFKQIPGTKEMWDYEANDCSPEDVFPSSKTILNWVCEKGHHFQLSPLSFRNKMRATCPECRRLTTTVFGKPRMMKFWDFEKNTQDVTQVSAKSSEKVHWKCPKCGYEWMAAVVSRTNDLCPCCDTGKVVCAGINDFATVYPQLGLDFIQELNPGVDATAIGIGSHERLNWKCHVCGYEWAAPVYGRIRKEKGERRIAKCPVCAGNKRVESYEKDYPQLAEIYSPRNKIPLPEMRFSRDIKYIWNCELHGEFEATFYQVRAALRDNRGNIGCPYCHGSKVKKEDSLGMLFPELAKEWSSENDVTPYEVTVGSKKVVFWECSAGHKWCASVATRVNGYGYCRECNTLRKGQRLFVDVYPEFKSFYSDKNDVPFERRTISENKKALWVCPDKGHEFDESFLNINQRGSFSCPICEFRKIVPGINDLQTLYPEAAAMYDVSKNEIAPDNISPKNSLLKVFWICEKGHSYSRSPAAQINWKNVCPVCSRHTLSIGDNDLKSQCPRLEELWDAEANGAMDSYFDTRSNAYSFVCSKGHRFTSTVQRMIDNDYQCLVCIGKKFSEEVSLKNTNPELAKEWSDNNQRGADSVTDKTKMSVLWVCPRCGGEYPYSIAARTVGDNVCPYCRGARRLEGYNDLLTTHPDLAREWSPNNKTEPTAYRKNSRSYALWICPNCQGEYSAEIRTRELGDNACPFCKGRHILEGFNDLATTHPELAAEWSPNNQYGPEAYKKTSLEYALWICPNCKGEYSSEIRGREIGDNACPYCKGIRTLKGFNDLATSHPELAVEWSPENEEPPDNFRKTEVFRAPWICPQCNARYGARICDRVEHVNACPYCRGIRVQKGINDLVTTHPDLIKEWSPNNEYLPETYQKASGDYVLWICPNCKGEYSSKIQTRAVGDNSCPFCKGIRVLKGFNDFTTTHPELVAEWSPNNESSPEEYYKAASAYALWNCPRCGGEYSAQIREREVGDDACPYCRGKHVLKGFNDLVTTHPELAAEWSPNNESSPEEYYKAASAYALWNCPRCGGEYRAQIREREVGDDACPYCIGKRVLKGFNDLGTTHPELVEEWAFPENALLGIRPDSVMKSDMRKVWWRCNDCKRKYYMSIRERLLKEKRGFTTCTYCRGRRINLIHFF